MLIKIALPPVGIISGFLLVTMTKQQDKIVLTVTCLCNWMPYKRLNAMQYTEKKSYVDQISII